MKRVANIFVSVVFIVDAHTSQLSERVKKLASVLKHQYANYEILIIDNGIPHETVIEIKKLLPKVACLRLIRLSKTQDVDTAIFAGVEASIGDNICVLYSNDPIELVTDFIDKNKDVDVVFGVATNLIRNGRIELLGAKIFYWYSGKYLHIRIPKNSTFYISMNRSVANALTRSGRYMRHIRHMAQQVGFTSATYEYELPNEARLYSRAPTTSLVSKGIDLVSNYSSHPLRVLSYFGLLAGSLNILYAVYVVIVNIAKKDVAKGWTTLSLQSSLMFFILFLILAVLAEYMGKILNETQQEPPYHIMQELSSTISIADETRLNVTK